MIRAEDDRLRSENDSRRNDGIGPISFEESSVDLAVRHRRSLPRTVWSSTEQQFAVNGRHGCLAPRGVVEAEAEEFMVEFGEFMADLGFGLGVLRWMRRRRRSEA